MAPPPAVPETETAAAACRADSRQERNVSSFAIPVHCRIHRDRWPNDLRLRRSPWLFAVVGKKKVILKRIQEPTDCGETLKGKLLFAVTKVAP